MQDCPAREALGVHEVRLGPQDLHHLRISGMQRAREPSSSGAPQRSAGAAHVALALAQAPAEGDQMRVAHTV